MRDAIYTIGLVIVVLAAFELGLRAAGVHYQASFYTPERERGFALRPNSSGWEVGENENYVRINSQGMNDREHSVVRPAGTIRIALVGSSETASCQIPREQNFESVMERDLAAATGKNIEVMNFGVPGYGMAQIYLTLKNHVWQYDPQIVIAAIPLSIVLKNIRSLYPGEQFDSPFFTQENGRLVLDAQSRHATGPSLKRLRLKQISSDWMNGCELLALLNEARIGMSRRIQGLRPPVAMQASAASVPADYMQVWPFLDGRNSGGAGRNPLDPRLDEAWHITEDLLRMMHADAVQHHAEFWLVTIDESIQVHPDPQVRAAYQKRYHLASLSASDERLDHFAQAENIHSLVLAPSLARYAEEHHVILHGFPKNGFAGGHWNRVGNKVAGDTIAAGLLQKSETLHASIR